MRKAILPLGLLVSSLSFGQNQPPVLSNVQVQLGSNNQLLIQYDLSDSESDACTITLRAAEKGAAALNFNTDNATGDFGAGVTPGLGKQITWDYSAYAAQANDFRLMLVADDLQPIDIQSLVDQVDSTRLYADLSFIEGVRHRSAGAAHLQETKDMIWMQLLDNGLETSLQEFAYGGYNAQNIVGKQNGTGTSGDTYILGGHFDTVSDAPGADDNGSAVAGMLEAVRILSQYPTKKSIKYIGFDLEEAGLLGSLQYTQNGISSGENIAGMIALEMIGYYSTAPNSQTLPVGFNLLFPDAYNEVASQDFKGNFITNVGKVGNSATLMQQFEDISANYAPSLRTVSVAAPANWQALTPDLGRSDHAPFWLENMPAIMLTDGANFRNPNYHTPNDKVETLNFTFMADVVKGTVATLAQLAEVQHADVWWTDTELFTPTKEAFGCVVNISPNPAHGMLKIEWQSCDLPIVKLSLLNAEGRTVLTAKPTSEKEHQFDINNLAAGIYYLKMENQHGTKVEEVVVK